jgi:hypothetical protein
MTADIIRINFVPRLMECAQCSSEAFSLHVDGTVRCLDCGGQANAKWDKLTSSSPPTGGEPLGAA